MGSTSITFEVVGDLRKTENFLRRLSRQDIYNNLEGLAKDGVNALASSTPKDSGKTAASWSYSITRKRGGYQISWTNSNINQGVPIAILLQYGHGTRTGGYVSGRDYINPAIRPVFDNITKKVWIEVTK